MITSLNMQGVIDASKYPRAIFVRWEDAEKSLAFFNAGVEAGKVGQRFLNLRSVAYYAKKMRRGEWNSSSGKPVMFNPEGYMINGQHRYAAQVKARKDLIHYIQYDVTLEQMENVASEVGRGAGVYLQSHGLHPSWPIKSAIQWAIHLYEGTNKWGGYRKRSDEELRDFLAINNYLGILYQLAFVFISSEGEAVQERNTRIKASRNKDLWCLAVVPSLMLIQENPKTLAGSKSYDFLLLRKMATQTSSFKEFPEIFEIPVERAIDEEADGWTFRRLSHEIREANIFLKKASQTDEPFRVSAYERNSDGSFVRKGANNHRVLTEWEKLLR